MESKKRKRTRHVSYDYSKKGAYFLTLCIENRRNILSNVVGEGLAPPLIHLTEYGKIAEDQLLLLERRYSYVKVDKYVIMPNHIHVILILEEAGGGGPSPTVSDIICSYKSITTRLINKLGNNEKLFQRSFYDHVIRDRQDYETHSRYIHENPICWYYDDLYVGD